MSCAETAEVAKLDTRSPDVLGRSANSLERAFGMRTVARPAARTIRAGWPSAAS